ncbi:Putative Mg2+ transporter protein, CorA-like/Zinc transport protein ZntB [Septoria linicola]|uniref:Mg2+ transporter protein, CorA-like/Zinc transport protein ZntB n=1 Tax=Septoria linicola TaxID=215465 RepID=A0A9Q9AJZ9_9PEZI|nr:putative Mg2+ transporter protein, CorA-like/Zinc transport protein ZntB [Septoria linicola]USW48308.1 Putative Mg2+ transporter protein, CorA-like/Zinc transport protein ZntB [Septoria linicola]
MSRGSALLRSTRSAFSNAKTFTFRSPQSRVGIPSIQALGCRPDSQITSRCIPYLAKTSILNQTRSLHNGQHLERWQPAAGAEPGLDPTGKANATDPPQAAQTSHIKIIDYSQKQLEERDVNSADLESFLRDQPKPDWATVRWIFVNGLDFSVVKCLGNSKELHPLAIEDVMDTHTTTKVDWYEDHCFLEMNLVRLSPGDQMPSYTPSTDPHSHGEVKERGNWRTLVPGRFGMSVEQVSGFLTSDNTVITIFEHSGKDVLDPIMTRLRSTQTVVRSSNDPSMLLQAVIDAVVDLSLPIGKAVGEAFDDLEQAVLAKPTIGQSKQLHILRSGLTQLMENANAIGILVRTLCDHGSVPGTGRAEGPPISPPKEQVKTSVEISPTTQIYLRDVQDHVTALSNNTRTSIRSAENLSSLIFNTIAASQNESVRSLTLVSSFFLPLTFLTGYAGMNFETMPIVQNHSDLTFWVIAIPVMATTMAILMKTRSRVNRPEPWRRQNRPTNTAPRRLRR